MKIASQRGFWSLRPTPTARGLELGCWFAAGLLALALAMSPVAPSGHAVQGLRPIGVPQAADLAYRQHCIDRVLASDLGMTEEYVVRQINQQCTYVRRRTAIRVVRLVCDGPFTVRFAPVVRRVTGCLAG